ncbi:hypothetical protein HK100_006736 [Physocladia obscura]|uniref:Vezatin n=1 Tax=Physocladia obscura TaxID=109957 RepID=A0AAD5SR28_9FUNG|nr:hypothetical protein HK100_006736 [Physocladia obscura]
MEEIDPDGPFAFLLENDGNDEYYNFNGENDENGESKDYTPQENRAVDSYHETPSQKQPRVLQQSTVSSSGILAETIAAFTAQQLHSLSSWAAATSQPVPFNLSANVDYPIGLTLLVVPAILGLSLYPFSRIDALLCLVPPVLALTKQAIIARRKANCRSVIAAFNALQISATRFDQVCHSALKFILEIELVSRGFNVTPNTTNVNPDKQSNSSTMTLLRCQILRATLHSAISSSIASIDTATTQLESIAALTPHWSLNDIQDLRVINDAKRDMLSATAPMVLEALKLEVVELKLRRVWFLQRFIRVREFDEAFEKTNTATNTAVGVFEDTMAVLNADTVVQRFVKAAAVLNKMAEQFDGFRNSIEFSLSEEANLLTFSTAAESKKEPKQIESLIQFQLTSLSNDITSLTDVIAQCQQTVESHFFAVAGVVFDNNDAQSTVKDWKAVDEMDGVCEGQRAFNDFSSRLEDVGEEEIFEGVPEDEVVQKKVPLSRQERIHIQKQRREEEANERASAQLSMRMVAELKTVLSFRKPAVGQ